MSREIKFRAWGKYTHHPGTELSMVMNWENCIHIEDFGFDGGEYFEIMQYTGLKDRNGVEIYEGDIIKFSNRGYEEIELVEWEKNYGCFSFSYMLQKLHWDIESCEVIGNIYENPELLEESL